MNLTLELSGNSLLWAILVAEEFEPYIHTKITEDEKKDKITTHFVKSKIREITIISWSTFGHLLERENILVRREENNFLATTLKDILYSACGASYLESAMRCYVLSKLGKEIEIPNQLLNN